jgi:hypothetical protein
MVLRYVNRFICSEQGNCDGTKDEGFDETPRARAHPLYIEVFMACVTIAVGGKDVDIALLMNLRKFIEEECLAGYVVLRGSQWSVDAQTFSNGGEGGF